MKKDDPAFRAHWLGLDPARAAAAAEPRDAFCAPKQACSNPAHASAGDCLVALWHHERIRKGGEDRCGLCMAMRMTIRMRRGDKGREAFERFDAWMRENLDYVCRAVDARHLVCFITNYATHGEGPERAAAAAAVWMNMAEKVTASTPERAKGVLAKVEGWPVSDGRFVKDRTYAHIATNFTMFDWKRGDAMLRTVEVMHAAMRDAPVVRRLTFSVMAWSAVYGGTAAGTVRRHGRVREWLDRILSWYKNG